MSATPSEKNLQNTGNKDTSVKPDPETLNTTDPQEEMEGPLSSLMHKAGDGMDTKETPEEADADSDQAS